jgi:hypothetical protein
MIITWNPEVYPTAASLASMLHEQGYDMDKVTELLRRTAPMRGLQDAIDRPRRRKGTLEVQSRTRAASREELPRGPGLTTSWPRK